jgi:hypothetical protein
MKNQSVEETQAENQAKIALLKSKFPKVFDQLDWLNIQDGWIGLVERLAAVIEIYLGTRIPEELKDQVYFTEIKQKFGQLRVGMSNYTPYVRGAIAMAQVESYHICEVCSERGSLRHMSWISILCDDHYHQKLEEQKADYLKYQEDHK